MRFAAMPAYEYIDNYAALKAVYIICVHNLLLQPKQALCITKNKRNISSSKPFLF